MTVETWVQVYPIGSAPGPDGQPLSKDTEEARDLLAGFHDAYHPNGAPTTRVTRRADHGIEQHWLLVKR